MFNSRVAMSGSLTYKVIKCQLAPLSWRVKNTLRWAFIKGWIAYTLAPIMAKYLGVATITSKLEGRVKKADGTWINYGVLGYRQVTTVGITAMALSFGTQASPGDFFYHGLGTGAGAEGAANTTLSTEATTEYATDNVRATGTHTESAGVYTTVATNTVDGALACTEHGIFSQASNAGGSLLDKTLFSVVNLASGDAFQTTFNLTFTAGG
jgi:hypothetical protein